MQRLWRDRQFLGVVQILWSCCSDFDAIYLFRTSCESFETCLETPEKRLESLENLLKLL